MKALDKRHFHKLYGVKKTRMTLQSTDFLDYVLMILICAAATGAVVGWMHPMSVIGYAIGAFMIATFVPRHGVKLRTPVILRRPQDALHMFIYKFQNLRPVWFIAIGVLLLENYLIYLTPEWPHHVELMRKSGFALFYIHFVALTVYRTVILVDHLRKKNLVREVLLQTSWRGRIEKRSIVLEIGHAYLTGILTHIVLLLPWYLVITFANFSVLALPVVLGLNVLLQIKFSKTFNDWFYREHWLGHNSELEFIYLHGSHHDAIPSGLIGVAGNGYLEGFGRQSLGDLEPFCTPIFAFVLLSAEVKTDIDFHQYIPGVFPKLSKQFHEIYQHSMHHLGSLEPYSLGLNIDQPHVTEAFKKKLKMPDAIMNSIKLDERLTGYKWLNSRYKNYLGLVDKYSSEPERKTAR